MNGRPYPQLHAAEFRRCILELDAVGIRKLWHHVAPGLHQPKDDAEALHTLHLARTKMSDIPMRLRLYSQAWLDERDRRSVALAVGVAVKFPEHRRAQGEDVRDAMSESVMNSYTAGIDLDTEAPEVRKRMFEARAKQHRFHGAILGHKIEE
jgi:hypothetical protein